MAAASTSLQQWDARRRDYRRYASAQVVSAIANVGISVLLAVAAAAVFGQLVIGFVAGLSAGLAYVAVSFYRNGGHPFLESPRRRIAALPGVARRYLHFPIFVLPSYLLATIGQSSAPFLLQLLFPLETIGHFAIANRFLLIPSAIIGGAIFEAFRSEFVDRAKRGEAVAPFFRRTLGALVAIALVACAAFLFFAPWAFALAFGGEYARSGEMAQLLSFGVLAQFVAQPFAYVFVATGRPRFGLVVQAVATLVPLVGLMGGSLGGDIDAGLLIYSALASASSLFLIAFAYQSASRYDAARTGSAAS